MQIEISEVNKILSDLSVIREYDFSSYLPNEYKLLETVTDSNWNIEYDGVEGKKFFVVKYEEFFIKVIFSSDSYGEINQGNLIQFVQPKTVTVTNYEAI